MSSDDLIVAFYPCIYFCAPSQMAFSYGYVNYRKLDVRGKTEKIIERDNNRSEFYQRLLKFVCVCMERGLRMVFENPWAEQTYLKANFIKYPEIVDNNRMDRGDYRIKPTAYWFFNCEPTHGFTYQNDKEKKTHMKSRGSKIAGLCSEERSMISTDYARNWICDFILGKQQNINQLGFDFGE